ncbi:hypothetical protein AVEN_189815-1 [Araneus ventricosus]|uniref:Uncharacterized protein n=1 Tax=Araneus ventricosus TaxID=182803 RepID=A0A4Y2RR71_ARAVE|nr:hypothetical protein AVEN_189815-1 [Araneus ventricosus]
MPAIFTKIYVKYCAQETKTSIKVANPCQLSVKRGDPKSFSSSLLSGEDLVPFMTKSLLQNVSSDDLNSHDLLSQCHVELLHFAGQKQFPHDFRRYPMAFGTSVHIFLYRF